MTVRGRPPTAGAARVGAVLLVGLLALVVPATAGAGSSGQGGQRAAGTTLPGTSCPAFPADNVWNTPVTGLPVAKESATWLASMGAGSTDLHPDYGPSGNPKEPYGIPWQIVPAGQPLVPITFLYASQSNHGPYPLSAATPIEQGSDRHAIMVNPATCTLYETWDTVYRAGREVDGGFGGDLEPQIGRPPPGRLDLGRCRRPAHPPRPGQPRRGRRRGHGPCHPVHRRSAHSGPICGRLGTRPVRPIPTVHRWEPASA